ncbi:hypothetical protein Tco_0132781 [Tanacetum coccineum]
MQQRRLNLFNHSRDSPETMDSEIDFARMRAEDNGRINEVPVGSLEGNEYDDYEEEGGEYEEQGRRLAVGPVKCENVAADEKESIPSKPEFCIEAGSVGNVARLINHNFDPNLFVPCVVSSHHDLKFALASDNIPLMQVNLSGCSETIFNKKMVERVIGCVISLEQITWKSQDRAFLTSSINRPKFLTGVCKVLQAF